MRVDWLKRYATGYHQWGQACEQDAVVYYRPLGVVESAFDADGVYHQGRADINLALEFEIKTTMPHQGLRKHIILAWTNLRLRHTLLCATASPRRRFMEEHIAKKSARWFVIRKPEARKDAVRWSEDLADFLDDYYSEVDADELYFHAQNTARTFDSSKTLARMLVLPLERTSAGSCRLRFLFIVSHQISDGLTNYNWAIDFMRLLNTSSHALENSIDPLIATLHERLAPAQEDLYQPISGSLARQRWFWAITLVLRHVQKPLPAAFSNPLRLSQGPTKASVPEQKLFERVLDYSEPPALNAGTITAHIGREGTRRLHSLCRQAGCSVGAGCFVLVAIVMMELYERRFPDVPLQERLAFMGSFPINPRPFFDHHAEADGVMLAFSDGLVLPFLSSDLDLDGRIKLLIRSAQRQLSRYQKRLRKDTSVDDMIQYMGPRGAGRVVPMTYFDTVERLNGRIPEDARMDLGYQKFMSKQANYTAATCGVSSVGKYPATLQPGQYDLNRPLAEDDLVADIRRTRQNVRPRDGEFLVGVWGQEDSIQLAANIDACSIDQKWAAVFEQEMGTILDRTAAQSRL